MTSVIRQPFWCPKNSKQGGVAVEYGLLCCNVMKDVSFYRIPKVIYGRSQRELELSRRQRKGYLAAISRADVTESIIEKGRICLQHFLSGKPASLFDETSPTGSPQKSSVI